MKKNNIILQQNEKKIPDIVSNNLKIIRKIKGLSLMEMGKILGCTGQQVQKYEVGKNKISIALLVRFANYLNIPISIFFEEISLHSILNQKK